MQTDTSACHTVCRANGPPLDVPLMLSVSRKYTASCSNYQFILTERSKHVKDNNSYSNPVIDNFGWV